MKNYGHELRFVSAALASVTVSTRSVLLRPPYA
jgi:hypothetical protein